ncbi:putative thymidine phosphorylase [Parvularcula lutaonensis]|nr:putative thymidine phosphorylase [Parvularcula lutaonensis]
MISDILESDEAGLSEAAWQQLGLEQGDVVTVTHAPPLASFSIVRRRVFGGRIDDEGAREVIADVVAQQYSDIHLAAFLTDCSATPLDEPEMIALTRAMVETGDRLHWNQAPIVDKHCVGGLPGNRTTPIIVSIVAAFGLTMPKTSSRGITSPAGTADVMETLAPVNLSLTAMRRVVEREGGCIVWGGSVHLAPSDDILIRVSRALDFDAQGPMVASVLSKKIAAGSTHVVIDIPVGPSVKVRSEKAAASLATSLASVAQAFGVRTRIIKTDGRQPVGRGVGPALEARDVVAVLRGEPDAPQDLRDRAVTLAGAVLELAGAVEAGKGTKTAREVLDDGRAWKKFLRIAEAQGGLREPPVAPHTRAVTASTDGLVAAIDCRKLARVAKLAGAPGAPAAGAEIHKRIGDPVTMGEPLLTLHAETPGELDYAIAFLLGEPDIFMLTTP